MEKDLIPLIQKYQTHLENRSVFDVISLDSTIEDVLEKPYVRPFIHKEHYDLLWVQDIYINGCDLFLFDAPTNLLLDPDQSELSFRENFVNPIVVKVFDDIMDLIKVKTGEIENQSNKTQRIETRQYKQLGFLEVVGNALYTNIKKLSEDTEKVFKCMQISIYYQCQHYISRGASEQEVSSIESYGIVVYQRKFTFYVMHRTNGVVDILTEFSIPNTKDQLYVSKEVIENVYSFKWNRSPEMRNTISGKLRFSRGMQPPALSKEVPLSDFDANLIKTNPQNFQNNPPSFDVSSQPWGLPNESLPKYSHGNNQDNRDPTIVARHIIDPPPKYYTNNKK
ncbi:hypothetical protein C1645_832040 [Glomus cerebriforme]|uniref:Uncharacterized protein n=1 Tax=Glomus cerebriforme TaxID=658196 RepID=A0A397SKF1_9GLOM|nr:hypothetical protein C1645_832040 [Glomus cerebriforme]